MRAMQHSAEDAPHILDSQGLMVKEENVTDNVRRERKMVEFGCLGENRYTDYLKLSSN